MLPPAVDPAAAQALAHQAYQTNLAPMLNRWPAPLGQQVGHLAQHVLQQSPGPVPADAAPDPNAATALAQQAYARGIAPMLNRFPSSMAQQIGNLAQQVLTQPVTPEMLARRPMPDALWQDYQGPQRMPLSVFGRGGFGGWSGLYGGYRTPGGLLQPGNQPGMSYLL